MAGYIGSGASVVSSGAERKKVFDITTNTTSLTGLNYTVGKVHVYHNGVRLVDGTDYTATNSTSITLTVAAVSGDQVVVVSYASFQLSEHYTSAEADAEFVTKTGDTMTGNLDVTGTVTADELNVSDAGKIGFNTTGSYTLNSVLSPDYGLGYTVSTNPINLSGYYGISFATNRAERLRIDSSGNVGIGTSSPSSPKFSGNASGVLEVKGTKPSFNIQESDVTNAHFNMSMTGGDAYLGATGTGNLVFATGTTNWSERMRIDSSGNVLVSQTTTADPASANIVGTGIGSVGYISTSRSGNPAAYFNRFTSDGDIALFLRGGTTVGSVGTNAGDLTIGTGDTGLKFADSSDSLVPWNISSNVFRDNAIDVGHANVRFDDIYATNGTIQTSDFNEKQDIASLTATEMLVGKRISALFKTFRWKDSVAENGDNARTHTGVIAQDVQAAFTAEGLDAGDYALFISSTWWEHDVDVPAVEAVEAVEAVTETTTDEDGNEVVTVITEAVEAVEAKDAYTRTDTYDTEAEAPEGATSKTRMGIRYPELLSFVAAYNEQRFASIEARLTALEA